MHLDEELIELKELINNLNISIDDLEDFEVLCYCTNTCTALDCLWF